jgi:hypothetical protein
MLPTCEKPVILCGRGQQDPGTAALCCSLLACALKCDSHEWNTHAADLVKRKHALETLGAQVFECHTAEGEDGRDHVDLRDAFRTLRRVSLLLLWIHNDSFPLVSSCRRSEAERDRQRHGGRRRGRLDVVSPAGHPATLDRPRRRHHRAHLRTQILPLRVADAPADFCASADRSAVCGQWAACFLRAPHPHPLRVHPPPFLACCTPVTMFSKTTLSFSATSTAKRPPQEYSTSEAASIIFEQRTKQHVTPCIENRGNADCDAAPMHVPVRACPLSFPESHFALLRLYSQAGRCRSPLQHNGRPSK